MIFAEGKLTEVSDQFGNGFAPTPVTSAAAATSGR
jgi:hypothetical protein